MTRPTKIIAGLGVIFLATIIFYSSPSTREGEYKSQLYNFSLFYPEEMKIKEFNEGAGARTITFEDEETMRGFQIFVVPYAGETISEERFRQDVPSLVRESLTNLKIDKVPGMSFYSQNLSLGETWEVWFIKDGFLYEVTTLRSEQKWLEETMKTWRFI